MSTPEVTPFHSQLPGEAELRRRRDRRAAATCSRRSAPSSAFVVVEEPVVGNEGVEAALAALRRERHPRRALPQAVGRADVRRPPTRSRGRSSRATARPSSASAAARRSISPRPARLLADAGGSVWDYLEGGRPFAPPALPLVLCPTTSGTGSEVSGASVLTDTERDRKVGIANGHMRAQHALVDPLLTLGLPPGPDGALRRRRAGAGDRRLHGARRQPALGRVRARGGAPHRPLARARRQGRLRSRRAPAARLRQPHRRALA